VLLTPGRFGIDRNEYFHGAPDVVVEIHSPGDESFDKLPFYAQLGVPEVWIIDRDTKDPQVFALGAEEYAARSIDADGWLRSPATGVEFRVETPFKLTLRLAGDEASRAEIPLG
jgi:Uma2 family endonuclease